MGIEGEYEECESCLGTGRDDGEADGRCVYCSGRGERFVPYPTEDDED